MLFVVDTSASAHTVIYIVLVSNKTTNFYKVTPDKYKELLHDNITKDYQKTTDTTAKNITTQDKKIAAQLDLDDRIDITAQKQAFITLKDHKDNFLNIQNADLLTQQNQR